jgi:cytochrome o ubiquinol oxidase subunit I
MTLLGKLSWQAIPLQEPLPLYSGLAVVIIIVALLAWVWVKGYVPYLWREWITSVDHKRIGVMYCILAAVMLLRGFIDAIMMRTQQAMAYNAPGYLPPSHFSQIF